ncbi:hypothetical protein AB205_0030020 [Aquarana catesbeiana]|uniref:Uncharacterized protein n=1 Tax=Aquarana catesbeiana TaxID=8400 RepID=A0A2G9RHB1_AQUCT|nr:hypothetical protein AB205_0030020 [Aquarana catesbeiana]
MTFLYLNSTQPCLRFSDGSFLCQMFHRYTLKKITFPL